MLLSAQVVDSVARRRVFFGHQSVGENILEGISELASQAARPMTFDAPPGSLGLSQELIGENEKPLSKIEHFEKRVGGELGGQLDIAFFKFCYVDFDAATDVEALFRRYQSAMAGLQSKHPALTLVHVTAPLTTVQSGPKAWVKKLLGRPLGGAIENERRQAFNEQIRKGYPSDQVFDLARWEATRPDGSLEGVESADGKWIPALYAGYTSDGGHLNARGRRVVGQALMQFLSTVRAGPVGDKP